MELSELEKKNTLKKQFLESLKNAFLILWKIKLSSPKTPHDPPPLYTPG